MAICVNGPQIVKHYLKHVKATKEIVVLDNWLQTADIGNFDEDGYVYLIHQMKELTTVQGFQVSQSELQDLLQRVYPGFGNLCNWCECSEEESPRAYVVKSDKSLAEEKVHAFMEQKAALYKQLAEGIEFAKSINSKKKDWGVFKASFGRNLWGCGVRKNPIGVFLTPGCAGMKRQLTMRCGCS